MAQEETGRIGKMIIIDTNVFIAMQIRPGIVRRIIIDNHDRFISPDFMFTEAWENRSYWNKNNMTEDELKRIFERSYDYIREIPREIYEENIENAKGLIMDPDDVSFVALALSVENEGIWTFNTKDFVRAEITDNIRILTTSEVVRSIYGRDSIDS